MKNGNDDELLLMMIKIVIFVNYFGGLEHLLANRQRQQAKIMGVMIMIMLDLLIILMILYLFKF